ncbi:DinB family protein [Nisaea sediminum]|uniref:DinB family protein n=1 Tax=Nisaea sediminum TaxID=2775867 RepID=UPI001867B8DE|nr:DinB family protein [Nisaea sediminum]
MSDLADHFRTMARYNRRANEVLYDACARLSETELKKIRPAFFNSIHGTLNHVLLGDRIWITRFEGRVHPSTDLDTILHEDFADLRIARTEMDTRIEAFFDGITESNLDGTYRYINNQGLDVTDRARIAFPHFFNHQTHHRGQVHALLSQTDVPPPSLDLHRLINPV